MSESREEARGPPSVPRLQKLEKNSKELRSLKCVKSAIWSFNMGARQLPRRRRKGGEATRK